MSKKEFRDRTLDEIDELSLCIFIINDLLDQKICYKLHELGGRVLSSVRAREGYSYSPFSDIFGAESNEYDVVFAMARKEDAKNIVEAVSVEFNFNEKGNGKAFIVDIEGYLGAKGAFLK